MDKQACDLEMYRIKSAKRVTFLGLLLSAALVTILFFGGMRTSNDIVAVVGIFTSITGTLVGMFIGVHVGSSGKEQERAEHRKSEIMKTLAVGMLTDEQRADVLKKYQEMLTKS